MDIRNIVIISLVLLITGPAVAADAQLGRLVKDQQSNDNAAFKDRKIEQKDVFSDAVAMGGYPIDIHSPDGAAMKHRFLRKGSWYSIPYRSLVTEQVENLIVAGRCLSATHEACAAVRVTPIVMAMGQAAGTAAAQSAGTGQAANRLDTDVLRKTLREGGVFLEEYQL